MPLHQLNYAILGHRQFQVFPYSFYDHVLIEEALKNICKRLGQSDTPIKLELWLVCDITAQD